MLHRVSLRKMASWMKLTESPSESELSRFAKGLLILSPGFVGELVGRVCAYRQRSYVSWTCRVEPFLTALKRRQPVEEPQVFRVHPIAGSPFTQNAELMKKLVENTDALFINLQLVWRETLVTEQTSLLLRLSSMLQIEHKRLDFDLFGPNNTTIVWSRPEAPLCSYCFGEIKNVADYRHCPRCHSAIYCSTPCNINALRAFHTPQLCQSLRQICTGFIQNWDEIENRRLLNTLI